MARELNEALKVLAQPGTVTMVSVLHDDWCPTLNTNRGEDCSCEYELKIESVSEG